MKQEHGFTLIELTIVLAIVGIITAWALRGSGDSAGIYGYLNSKDVSGRLESVTSAMPAGSIVGNNYNANVFQAGVVIKEADGSLISFSTQDRQWASFEGNKAQGKCVTARIFPYAPWELSKAKTYHAGRLLSVKECT